MTNPHKPQQTNPQISPLLTMKLLWGFLFFALGLYAFIANNNGSQVDSQSALFLPLAIISTFSAIFGLLITPRIFHAALKTLPQDATKEQMFKAYFVSFILKLALFESIAIFGLMIAMQGSQNQSHLFFVTAALLFLTAIPSENKILEQAKSVKNFTNSKQ